MIRRLLLITDTWEPQTNGVVTMWRQVNRHLEDFGVQSEVIHPGLFRNLPLPGYGEIRIAWNLHHFDRLMEQANADAVHIATEGPLGYKARAYCKRAGLPFTSSVHTKFPEYAQERLGFGRERGYRWLRRFHGAAETTLAMSASQEEELKSWGFENTQVWTAGVDLERFQPRQAPRSSAHPPTALYVGRVAVEKNLRAFLEMGFDGRKVVVGDGPAREELESHHPDVDWQGYLYGDELVAQFAAADVFVFPSRTDTFGLVMLEANACGTPVAAYPVTGPLDLVTNGINGYLHDDLTIATERALLVPRSACRRAAEAHGWHRSAADLLDFLAPLTARPTLQRYAG